MKSRIAILAALPREIAPLVRDWPVRTASRREGFLIAECDRAIAACAGMGSERVARALEMAEARGSLRMILSVGYAGALRSTLKRNALCWPSVVIEASTGEHYASEAGSGTLVTVDHVVNHEEKLHMAKRWNADLVDMETAAVARLAQMRGLPFRALRVVSDEAGEVLPDLNRFTDPHGGFREVAFAGHVAMRPWLIPVVVRMGRHATRASKKMAQELKEFLERAE